MKEFWVANRTIYPAVFRVLIGLVLLTDLIFTLPSGYFLFDSNYNASLPVSNIHQFFIHNWKGFAGVYAAILIFFIVGIGKNISSFLVAIMLWFWIDLTMPLLTWGDTIIKYTMMYFVVVNSFQFLAFRPSKTFGFLSTLGIWSIILHIFLIYLNNGFYKMMDLDWQEGRALFYSFSQYSGFETSIFKPIISNEFASKYLGYFIILQQISFVPMVLWRKTRYVAILISILIHLTMMVQFELWKFELIVILLYGFLLNDSEWRKMLPAQIQAKFFSSK